MFLKRSLVMMVGILLFIGFFLLKFHLSDARIENEFKKERVQYGVQDAVLTLPYASPPIPAAPPASAPASTPPAPEASAPGTTSDNPATAPGNAPDTNVIIGPVPPSAAPTNETPAPEAVPAPDTNGGPMVPSPSTLNLPRERHSSFLVMAAYRPSRMIFHAAEVETGQGTNSTGGESATEATSAREITNTKAPGTPGETNAAQPATNASSIVPATTNGTPALPANVPGHAASAGARAIVLGYHQFTGPGVSSKNIYSMSQDVFESEMKYLHDNGYNVVPLSDVVKFVKHEGVLPPNAVAITIDDGYKSALVYAGPVLKKYGYPWTYFVYPQFITRTEGKGAASWPDLVELDKEGVDVECHSMTHPQLSRHRQLFTETPAPDGGMTISYGRTYHQLSDKEYDDFLTNETFGSKAILEKELNKKIKYFAYPYGDFNKQVQAKVVAAGYEAVFTVADNPVHVMTDIHSIGRYIITRPVERAFASYLHQGALGLVQVDPEPGATTGNPRPVITAVLGFIGDPASLETDVRDFGMVRHDFDPQTSTVRLYLPRDLIQPEVMVSIHAKDKQSGQTMVANWHFNYEPTGTAPATHEPISAEPATNTAAGESSSNTVKAPTESSKAATRPETNAAAPATTNVAPIPAIPAETEP